MTQEIAPRISVDPQIRFGRPVIRSTRVPVELVVGKLAGGMTAQEVADEYELALEDIYAALSYAANARRLARLGGSEPQLQQVSRRRPASE